MKGRIQIPLLLWGLSVLSAAATMTIQFDPPPVSGGSCYTNAYVEQDMRFSTTNGFFHRDSGDSVNNPDNGSAYLHFAVSMQPLIISNSSSLLFDLISVDLSEYSTFANPFTVPFTGYKSGGSTVSTTFTLDGVIDGTGPNSDFQTFFFDAAFTDMTHVEVGQVLYGMDNLVLEGIPEPGTGVLAILGGLLCVLRVVREKLEI